MAEQWPAVLTAEQWGRLMVEEGFPAKLEVIATGLAILYRENRFKTAGQDYASSGHYGGWQERENFYGCSTIADRENPRKATRCAANAYKARGWADWAPYSGPYDIEPWLPAARRVLAGAGGDLPTTTAGPGTAGSSSAGSSGAGLFGGGERSGALKALVWVAIMLGGAALAGIGIGRLVGIKPSDVAAIAASGPAAPAKAAAVASKAGKAAK